MIRPIIFAFLFATTVFQMCGDLNKPPPPVMKSDPSIQPDPSGLPLCLTDPPYLCMAACMGDPGGIPEITPPCNTGNALADEFEQQVNAYIDQAITNGLQDQLCIPGSMFYDITPCELGITPQLLEEPPACQLPKPDCAL